MTEQITVPRETWDATVGALKNIAKGNLGPYAWQADYAKIRSLAIQALTAANAVSEPKVKLIPTAEEMGTPMQPQYSLDADPQGIRARVVSAVVGAMAYGARGENKPPEGHWLNEVWDIARAETNRVHPQATEPAWRPIETAPKDGTPYLALEGADMWVENEPEGHFAGVWQWSESRRQWRGHAHSDDRFATHWMPLPAAPEAKQ